MNNPITGTGFGTIVQSILSGLEGGIFSIVLSILTLWMPQLAHLSTDALDTIGNNFRKFLQDVGNGAPWGTALADMMTADWNEVEDDAKQAAIDFAEDVATALATAGFIPQGK